MAQKLNILTDRSEDPDLILNAHITIVFHSPVLENPMLTLVSTGIACLGAQMHLKASIHINKIKINRTRTINRKY